MYRGCLPGLPRAYDDLYERAILSETRLEFLGDLPLELVCLIPRLRK